MRWLVVVLVVGLAAPAAAQSAGALGSPWGPRTTPDVEAPEAVAEPDLVGTSGAEPGALVEPEPVEPLVRDAGASVEPGVDAVVDVVADTPALSSEPIEIVEVPEPERVTVHVFGGGRRRLSLFAGHGEDAERLCEAPCELELEPGAYELGVGVDDDPVRRPDHDRIVVREGEWLELVYSNRHAHRVGAAIMLGLGVPTGLAMFLSGWIILGISLIIPGGILLGFALAYGIPAAFIRDHVDVRERGVIRF